MKLCIGFLFYRMAIDARCTFATAWALELGASASLQRKTWSLRHAYRDPRDLRADARHRQGARFRLSRRQRYVEPDAERRAARVRRRWQRRHRADIDRRRRVPVRAEREGHGD